MEYSWLWCQIKKTCTERV